MLRRRLRWHGGALACAVFCAGGAALTTAADANDEETEAPLDVETILANPLGAEDYRRGQRCLSRGNYREIEVLDESNLLFVGRRRTWLNRLRSRCPGLRQNMVIYLNQRGSRICQFDDFRARHRIGPGFPTPACVLGEFEAIDPAQVEGLRDAVPAHTVQDKGE